MMEHYISNAKTVKEFIKELRFKLKREEAPDVEIEKLTQDIVKHTTQGETLISVFTPFFAVTVALPLMCCFSHMPDGRKIYVEHHRLMTDILSSVLTLCSSYQASFAITEAIEQELCLDYAEGMRQFRIDTSYFVYRAELIPTVSH